MSKRPDFNVVSDKIIQAEQNQYYH